MLKFKPQKRYITGGICIFSFAVIVFFLFPFLPIKGNYSLKTALSGSMEPAIHTGAVAFIMPAQKYQVGDIITFKRAGQDIPTTHRIYDKTTQAGKTLFITKGDANENPDPQPVAESQIMGKVYFSIPYLGYAAHYAQTKYGFMALIFIPAAIIILGELRKIYKEIGKMRQEHR